MKRYILFDLDGTLTESGEGIINSLKYSLDRMGIYDYDKSLLNRFIGPPLGVSYRELFGLSEEDAKRAIGFYREYFSEVGLFENRVYDGVVPALLSLIEAKMTLAVATSKPEIYTLRILERFKLRDYFTVIKGTPLDRVEMPKAEVIRDAVRLLGALEPSICLMVGDRSQDVIGAAKNGIDCLGVTYGYGTPEELMSAGAVGLADTPEDVCHICLGL